MLLDIIEPEIKIPNYSWQMVLLFLVGIYTLIFAVMPTLLELIKYYYDRIKKYKKDD